MGSNDSVFFSSDCRICNSDNVGVINQMLLAGMTYKKVIDAFKGKVDLTNHILKTHKRDHFDNALRADLIDSVKKGKIKVHNTAVKLYQLIEEWEEVYHLGKKNLVKNLSNAETTNKSINALKGMFSVQKDLLKFNAALLKETDDEAVATIDLTQIAHKLSKHKSLVRQ